VYYPGPLAENVNTCNGEKGRETELGGGFKQRLSADFSRENASRHIRVLRVWLPGMMIADNLSNVAIWFVRAEWGAHSLVGGCKSLTSIHETFHDDSNTLSFIVYICTIKTTILIISNVESVRRVFLSTILDPEHSLLSLSCSTFFLNSGLSLLLRTVSISKADLTKSPN